MDRLLTMVNILQLKKNAVSRHIFGRKVLVHAEMKWFVTLGKKANFGFI